MRVHDWAEKLAAYVEAGRTRSFSYGAYDCGLFAADWILLCTGIDPAAELRGYDSRIGAARIVQRYGSLEAMVTALLAREPIPTSFAQRGDLVIAELQTEEGQADCIGICCGHRCAFPGTGVVLHPTSQARLAWTVD